MDAHRTREGNFAQRKNRIREAYRELAPIRERWIRRNRYYYRELARIVSNFIEPDGDLLQTCVALMSIGVLARAPLPWLVRQGTPAASDGLGSAVVGQMPVRTAAVGSATATVVVIVALMVWWSPAIAFGAAVAAWVTAVGLRRSAIRRFQVVNGDVLGASIEMTALVGLLALAML